MLSGEKVREWSVKGMPVAALAPWRGAPASVRMRCRACRFRAVGPGMVLARCPRRLGPFGPPSDNRQNQTFRQLELASRRGARSGRSPGGSRHHALSKTCHDHALTMAAPPAASPWAFSLCGALSERSSCRAHAPRERPAQGPLRCTQFMLDPTTPRNHARSA